MQDKQPEDIWVSGDEMVSERQVDRCHPENSTQRSCFSWCKVQKEKKKKNPENSTEKRMQRCEGFYCCTVPLCHPQCLTSNRDEVGHKADRKHNHWALVSKNLPSKLCASDTFVSGWSSESTPSRFTKPKWSQNPHAGVRGPEYWVAASFAGWQRSLKSWEIEICGNAARRRSCLE